MIDRMKLICGSSTRLAAMLAILDGPKTTAQIAEGLDGPEMANIAAEINRATGQIWMADDVSKRLKELST